MCVCVCVCGVCAGLLVARDCVRKTRPHLTLLEGHITHYGGVTMNAPFRLLV